jgi:hypothetical protein
MPDTVYAHDLTFAEDDLTCLWAPSAAWSTAEAAHAALVLAGLDPAAILMEEVRAALVRVASGETGIRVTIARGKAPLHGTNAVLDLDVLDESVTSLSDADRIDVRDRGTPTAVDAGQVLGRYQRATPGTPGLSVRGRVLEARPGVGLDVQIREGVDVDSDGLLRATLDGFLVFRAGVLTVQAEWRVPGDVDHHVGHVRLDRGDILVAGTVKPGFRLETPGNIFVKGDVEGAWLAAGGDIHVQGVAVSAPEGALRAAGRVEVARVVGLTVEAGGDLVIHKEAYDCTLRCGGRLTVNGRLVGGDSIAARGAEVGILGSAAYVQTRLAVGKSAVLCRELAEQISMADRTIRRLELLLGMADRPVLRERLRALAEDRAARAALLASLEGAEGTADVQVRRACYPGVTLEIDGRVVPLDPGPPGPRTVSARTEG